MAVYVDSCFIQARVGRITARWCHLIADDLKELHAFAAKIGLKREWAQLDGLGLPHYDVTESKRSRALANGARVIGREDFVARMRAYRDARRQ